MTSSSAFPKLIRFFQGFAEEETWGTQLTNGTEPQPCRLEEVETLSQGCDGMEAVIGCRLMFRRFRYRTPPEESIIDRLLDKNRRDFFARVCSSGASPH